MSCKFFVYAGGRWREVETSTGRVQGWGRGAKFVYRRGSRLVAARKQRVLRELQALAAGRPAAVRDSAPLLTYKQKDKPRYNDLHNAVSQSQSARCTHHCCGAHVQQCDVNSNQVDTKPPKVTVATQCTANASTQVSQRDRTPSPEKSDNYRNKINNQITSPRPRTRQEVSSRKVENRIVSPIKSKNDVSSPGKSRTETDKSKNETRASKRKHIEIKQIDEVSVSSQSTDILSRQLKRRRISDSSNNCKELVIEEDDVVLLRRYLVKNSPSVDIDKFDNDEDYKRMVFFKINPLVVVQRCKQIEQMLRSSQDDNMTLKDFAIRLGLTAVDDMHKTVRYKTRHHIGEQNKRFKITSESETDKENRSTERQNLRENTNKQKKENRILPKKVVTSNDSRKKVQEKDKIQSIVVSSESEEDEAFQKCRAPKIRTSHTISKQPSSNKSREYSNLEDHAIVSWISSGDRASLVNGNQVWRQLQQDYTSITGNKRSWHSLRNRYLRYILPSLGALALPPKHQARLRAAAAAGRLKSRKSRNNSIHAVPAVQSAWSRRPRPSPPPSPSPSSSDSPPKTVKPPSSSSDSHLKPILKSPVKRAVISDSSDNSPKPVPLLSSSPVKASSNSSSSAGRRANVSGRVTRTSHANNERNSPPPTSPRLRPRTPAAAAPPSPPLTYSEVTRRFALRQRVTRNSDQTSGSTAAETSANRPQLSKTRRLYNPSSMI